LSVVLLTGEDIARVFAALKSGENFAGRRRKSEISVNGDTYYLDGNQATKTNETGITTSYFYDSAGRLSKEAEGNKETTYTYDANGNRATISTREIANQLVTYHVAYTHDSNDRLTKTVTTQFPQNAVTANYTYDANGNQLTDGKGTYTYDAFNRLTSSTISGTLTTYKYKADGLRYSKTTGGVTTTHLWDGSNIVADVANNTVKTYVRGVNLISDGTNYFLYNAHGDIVNLVDNAGVVTKTYVYDAFGVEKNPVSTDANPWRYCGEYYDKETDTIYLRARYYSPKTGRFTQQDPIRNGLNWYTYCGNDPISRIDPSGLLDVMVQYIAEKNKGSVTVDKKEMTVTVIMNNKTKIYSESEYTVMNSMVIIDNEVLMKDFGISEKRSTHRSGDLFNTEDHTAMAFGFMYNAISIEKNREYGAFIYENGKNKFSFGTVSIGTGDYAGITLPNIFRNAVSFVHTHAAYDSKYGSGNENFSDNGIVSDIGLANFLKINCYMATPSGTLQKYTYANRNNSKGGKSTIPVRLARDINSP